MKLLEKNEPSSSLLEKEDYPPKLKMNLKPTENQKSLSKIPMKYKQGILLLGDIGIFLASIYLAVYLRYDLLINLLQHYPVTVFLMVFSYAICFYIFDLYSNLDYKITEKLLARQQFYAMLSGTLLVTFIFYLLPQLKFGRGLIGLNFVSILVFSLAWRKGFHPLFAIKFIMRRIVIVGAGFSGKTIYNVLAKNSNFEIIGFLDDNSKSLGKAIGSVSVIGSSKILLELIRHKKIDEIVVAITHEKSSQLLKALLHAKIQRIKIFDMQTLYEKFTGKISVDHLRDGWIVYTDFHGMLHNVYMKHLKRLMDIGFSLVGLFLSLPIMLITAIAIKIDSKGPIFFKQKRVGRNKTVFNILKFRSMRVDAESNGAQWATVDDSRMTRVGKFIRRVRIDEIPQMLNVLNGAMSFIGPRPERPEFVKDLEKEIPFYSVRHAMNPGITGWAQVNYRYGASVKDALTKLQYDLFYIKNFTLLLDLNIFLKTIHSVLFRNGSR